MGSWSGKIWAGLLALLSACGQGAAVQAGQPDLDQAGLALQTAGAATAAGAPALWLFLDAMLLGRGEQLAFSVLDRAAAAGYSVVVIADAGLELLGSAIEPAGLAAALGQYARAVRTGSHAAN